MAVEHENAGSASMKVMHSSNDPYCALAPVHHRSWRAHVTADRAPRAARYTWVAASAVWPARGGRRRQTEPRGARKEGSRPHQQENKHAGRQTGVPRRAALVALRKRSDPAPRGSARQDAAAAAPSQTATQRRVPPPLPSAPPSAPRRRQRRGTQRATAHPNVPSYSNTYCRSSAVHGLNDTWCAVSAGISSVSHAPPSASVGGRAQ